MLTHWHLGSWSKVPVIKRFEYHLLNDFYDIEGSSGKSPYVFSWLFNV